MTEGATNDGGFNPRLVIAVVVVGVIAFIALWALIALGPQLSSGNDGRGHALSKAAPGYAGIVDLLERSNATVTMERGTGPVLYEEYNPLLVLTPTHRTKTPEITELLTANNLNRSLVVLPKWIAGRVPGQKVKAGWVSAGYADTPPAQLLPPAQFGEVKITARPAKAQTVPVNIAGRRFSVELPEDVQTVEGAGLETLIAGPAGGAVLARTRDKDLYILADPDLINNLALRRATRRAPPPI